MAADRDRPGPLIPEVVVTRSPSTPLTLAGGLLLASLGPAVPFFLDGRPFREVAGGPVHLGLYALTLAGMLALLVAVPRLGSLPAPRGRRLPEGVLTAGLLATALMAATHVIQVLVTPHLARIAPDALDASGGLLMVGMVTCWIVFLAAWAGLGVLALRRGVLPLPAGVLLVVGAVAQPVAGPLAALPFGLGLLLTARVARAARAVPVPADAPEPAVA